MDKLAEEILELIQGLVVYYLGIHVIYSALIFLLGNIMVDYYELGIFRSPTNIFQKIVNFFTNFFLGSGPFIYRKLERYPWLLRKLYMLVATIFMFLLTIPIYYSIKYLLHLIF